jgi:hypothetical protein
MIGAFLIKLVEHPDTLSHYLRDPLGSMQAEGLSDREIEIVMSGNLRRLREALQQERPGKDIFLAQVPHVAPAGHAPQVQPPDDGNGGESEE